MLRNNHFGRAESPWLDVLDKRRTSRRKAERGRLDEQNGQYEAGINLSTLRLSRASHGTVCDRWRNFSASCYELDAGAKHTSMRGLSLSMVL